MTLNISRKQIRDYYEDRFKEIASRRQLTQGQRTKRVNQLSEYYAGGHRTEIQRLIMQYANRGGESPGPWMWDWAAVHNLDAIL